MANNKRIGELLVDLEFITKEQLNAALLHQKKDAPQKKVGEILVELGFLNELDLLRCLAGLFRIRYLSSDKLSKMTIPQWILNLIPLEFAEKYNVLPFFCYDKAKILSVVISEPQDRKLPKLIKNISGYNEVEKYLALGSTINAAIAMHYKNDYTAFDRLKELNKGGVAQAIASFAPRNEPAVDSEYSDSTEILTKDKRKISDRVESPIRLEDHKKRLSDHISSLSLMSDDTFIEVLNIIINVLEIYKGERFKGHSANVARIVKEISKNMDLKTRETYYNVVGAYLHDCCMNAPEHLSLLSFNTEEGVNLIKKYAKSSKRIFEKARLPGEVENILFHTFERYDGKGYPDGLKGKEIPLGSRIIATVDAFNHLLNFEEREKRSENPYKFSFNTIKSFENKYFDPEVIEKLEEVIIDNFIDEKSPRVVIVDGNSEELNVFILRLKRNGILPYLTDDTDKATNILKNTSVNLIISEINTQPMDGFSFCHFIKTHPKYKNIGFIFLSKENDSNQITKGFEAGADDFMAKPYNPDLLIAKINNFIKLETKKTEEEAERSTRKKGITGNLAEVQIAELIQMLSRGRKTGVLKLFKDEEDGKIFFYNGQIINAQYLNTEGVEAFNNLIRWEHGLFILDPDAKLSEQKIYESTEMLLIEACRLWDEEKSD